MKLSILIPTLSSRADKCLMLVDYILDQVESLDLIGEVEVVTLWDQGEKSVGEKRNELIQMAQGEYICFVDDDDRIARDFIGRLMGGIDSGADCCSLRGVITFDGKNPALFEHSLRYKEYKENYNNEPIRYERMPNHLNCVKKSLVVDIKFPEIRFGEDTDWAHQVRDAGVLKTEHYIDSVLYHYDFITTK